MTKVDHAYAVAAAAAHDLNDDLTVILSSVSDSIHALEPGHPARPYLLDLQEAAERCTRTTSGLLAYSFREGRQNRAVSLEALIVAA
jgi:C4-dicarboxylate-specific signal transduction histidine kinase